jgi:hypothetical protein
MTRELEDARFLLFQAKTVLENKSIKRDGAFHQQLQSHFNKYAPKDPLREAWGKFCDWKNNAFFVDSKLQRDESYKKACKLGLLLTPERESELKREGWNEAISMFSTELRQQWNVIGPNGSIRFDCLIDMVREQLRKPPKGE